MAGQYRHTTHTTYSCLYHVIWITKYRKKVLRGDIGLRLRDIIRQVCASDKVDILKGSIGPDHVHMLLQIPPFISVSRLLQHLKGESSRKLQIEFPAPQKQFWGQHLWQIGYFCSTVGQVTEKTVRDYIAEQGKKEEHEDKTFLVLEPD